MPPSYESVVGSNIGSDMPTYLHECVAPPYDNEQLNASDDGLILPPSYEFAVRNNINATSSR